MKELVHEQNEIGELRACIRNNMGKTFTKSRSTFKEKPGNIMYICFVCI